MPHATPGATLPTPPRMAPFRGPGLHCVNWPIPRDNFVNGNLELCRPSSATDTYATVQTKSNEILAEVPNGS